MGGFLVDWELPHTKGAAKNKKQNKKKEQNRITN